MQDVVIVQDNAAFVFSEFNAKNAKSDVINKIKEINLHKSSLFIKYIISSERSYIYIIFDEKCVKIF